ncbi:MAG: hypothetical protein Q4A72_03560 [Bacillota bacterium]|nr:hypothetical protein [Bacillota bacterium]
MELMFERLPQTLEELKTCEFGTLEKPEYTAALFVAAMTKYSENPELCLQMVDYLNGPTELTAYDKQFLRDRMRDKDYLPWSYFKGATPENDYRPSEPYTVTVERNPYSEVSPEHVKLFLQSGGADSPRPIEFRLKPSTGQWFMINQLLLAGIRLPKSRDEWA